MSLFLSCFLTKQLDFLKLIPHSFRLSDKQIELVDEIS